VQLHRVVPAGSARVLFKLDSANPTGSMKDRLAKAMVEAALRDGRLTPSGTVVEYTGGTTGVSLASVCAALGLRSHFVSSDAFSAEKLRTIRAFGGELTLIPSEGRRITRELIEAMTAKAKALSQQPGRACP
jgi:cysteine synthase A